MTAKEPIEMLEEMYRSMQEMRHQISIMDTNIKLIQAKLNSDVLSDFHKKISELTATTTTNTGIPRISPVHHAVAAPTATTPDPIPLQASNIPQELASAYRAIAVWGREISDDGKPMSGVAVKILNSDKKVIKETTTNRAGIWQAHLKPGKYIYKALIDGKPTKFKLFEAVEGQTNQEV